MSVDGAAVHLRRGSNGLFQFLKACQQTFESKLAAFQASDDGNPIVFNTAVLLTKNIFSPLDIQVLYI